MMMNEYERAVSEVEDHFDEAVCVVCRMISIPVKNITNLGCNCRQTLCLRCIRIMYDMNLPPKERKLPQCIICKSVSKKPIFRANQAYIVDFRFMDDIDDYVRVMYGYRIFMCNCDIQEEDRTRYTMIEYYQHIREDCTDSLTNTKCTSDFCKIFLKRRELEIGLCESCSFHSEVAEVVEVVEVAEVAEVAEDEVNHAEEYFNDIPIFGELNLFD